MAEMLWRMTDIGEAVKLSPRTISRLRAKGSLPPPDFHFGRCVRWKPASIEAWVISGGLSEAMSN
jgi:predicted DNA-binding transcriptional regulator AlpA